MTNGVSSPGWYQDPTGQGEARYWNGSAWTQSVSRGGVTLNIGMDPSQIQVPPMPGTLVTARVQPASMPAQTVNMSSSGNSVLGVFMGTLTVLFLVVLIYAIISNNISTDDTSTPTTEPATEVQPEPTDAPAVELPAPTDPPTAEAPEAEASAG